VVIIRDIKGQEIKTMKASSKSKVRCVAFSMDGKYLSCGYENGNITIFEVDKDYAVIKTLKHDNQVVSLKWHHQFPLLLSTSADNSAIIWTEE
jgi:WD40 repeat protein